MVVPQALILASMIRIKDSRTAL
eukprot:COSAG06_NODE_47766_length_337_cov_0.621849_1_plen_22_part_10